jgi:Tol biopolymer transport system component
MAALAGTSLIVGAVGGGTAAWLLHPSGPEPPLRRFEIPADDLDITGGIVMSPDGRKVVYTAGNSLWLRELSSLEPRELVPGERTVSPFWSPDSAYVGYSSEGRLWKVPVEGGRPTPIASLPSPMSFAGGAAWGTDGRIVFTTGDTGLLEVSAQGGDPVPRLDVDQETEDDYHDATPLPDGRGVLFVIHRLGSGPDTIALLAGDTKNVLLQQTGESFFGPMYSPTGHILYNRATTTPGVWALPFSLSDLEVTGEPFLVAPDASWPSVSADGTLAYVPGSSFDSLQLVWVDRDGSVEGVVGQPQRSIFHPALSPNADRVAVSADENENRDVWIHDVARGTVTRLTFTDGEEWVPGWSLSGDEVTYLTAAQGDATGWSKAADGTGEARSLGITAPRGYTPDGRYLLFTERGSGTRGDVGFVDLEGDGERVMILQSAANESSGELSPDGSFLVYESDESGREEIYLTRFPSGEGRWQVSLNGGVRPRWNPSGGELFFTYETTLYAVEVELEPTVRLGTPDPLFNAALLGISVFNGYDIAPDGQRFIFVQSEDQRIGRRSIAIVENWFSEFRDRR